MTSSKWKKRIVIVAAAVIFVLAMIFAFNKFVLQNPTRLRTIALNKTIEKIQWEIDNNTPSENTINVIYDETYEYSEGMAGVRKIEYYINNNEDKNVILSALRHSSYIYGTPAYQPLLYSEDLYIGDFQMGISYLPHISTGGYIYQVDKHNDTIISNILIEIRDSAGLDE